MSFDALRPPSEFERQVFLRLLTVEFRGRKELAGLLESCSVRRIDENHSVEIVAEKAVVRPAIRGVPVEAETSDTDGMKIHVLLHVVAGSPVELQIYREDAGRVRSMPPPGAWSVMTYQPRPRAEDSEP